MTESSDIASNETRAVDHVSMRLERATGLVRWLAGELDHLARAGMRSADEKGNPADGQGNAADGHAYATGGRYDADEQVTVRRLDRMVDQLAMMCRLVEFSLEQVELTGELDLGWILLEQARQQLGHAAITAAAIDRGRWLSEAEVDDEVGSKIVIMWMLQRDRMPWAENAGQVVDFGCSSGRPPDFRPETPLELVPLQFLADSVMRTGTGTAIQELPETMLAMAYGEYVFTIMDEAMELLELRAGQAGESALSSLVDTGHEVANLVSGAYPAPWQVFGGPAGLTDAA